MSNMVTRCPQCQTSFKVTDEHLKIANGAVRCGSCLLVFQARQHWASPDNMAAAAAPASAAGGKFRFDQSAIDNSAAAIAPGQAVGQRPANAAALQAAASNTSTSDQETTIESPTYKKLDEIGDDERISDDLDIEDDEDEIVSKVAAQANKFGEPDDDYDSVFDDFEEQAKSSNLDYVFDDDFKDLDALIEDTASGTGVADTSDDAWAKKMLADLEQENKPEVLDLGAVDNIRDVLTDFTNPVDVDAARRDLGFDREEPFAARELGEKNTGRGNEGRAEMIAHIEPLPVEMLSSRLKSATDWKSILLWNVSAVALASLLAAQYVSFNFDKLAKSGAARPYMQAICNVVGCQLPSVENWRYVKIQNLIVRQHPQAQDALAVDAILFNVTGQELPFPQIELYFSDISKIPVASRRFEPAEYLSGELSGQTMIPPGRPVHIALEIVNPGDDAVNWSLQVAGKTN